MPDLANVLRLGRSLLAAVRLLTCVAPDSVIPKRDTTSDDRIRLGDMDTDEPTWTYMHYHRVPIL